MSRNSGENRKGPRKRILQVLLSDEEYDAIDYVASEMQYPKSTYARIHIMRGVKEFTEARKNSP